MNRFTKIFFPILITDYRSLITSLLLTPISLLLFSCNSTEPVTNESLYVAAIDASCTEVWLEIKTENITLPTKINLLLDGELVGIISLMDKDTVFIHRSLQPSTTYNYQVSKNGLKSNLVTFTTLDTTSSNYIWEKYYFGNIGSSILCIGSAGKGISS